MNLSLSVRIAEGFLSKEEAILSLNEVVDLAVRSHFDAICMRASQVGIQSSPQRIAEAAGLIQQSKLAVSMVTGDFDTVYNNQNGPNCLKNITPFLDLASQLGSSLIRVALKTDDDIPSAQRAADEAKERGIRLAHQCHTLSLFETVDGIEQALTSIDRDNFGLIFEPANLELCGQDYGPGTIQRLARWLFNVYFQNQQIKLEGAVTLSSWCRGPVRFDIIPIHQPGGIDFDTLFDGLRGIGYSGTITVHQSVTDGESPKQSARQTADFLRQRMSKLP